MESKTITPWDKLMNNPPQKFKNYIIEEEKFLKENIKEKDIVLEIGCGTGRTMQIISKLCREIIGIDNDKSAVNEGVKKIHGLKNAKIIFEDGEKMSFSNSYFDKIFIGFTFSNFGNTKDKILFEIKRVLKNNGLLLFNVYNEFSLDDRLKNYERYDAGNFIVKENGLVEFNYDAISEQISEKQIRKILIDNNFEILEIKKLDIFYLIKARNKK